MLSAPVKRPPMDIRNRPRIPIPDEDPYSVAGSGGSSGSSGVGGSGGSASASNGGIVAATREQLQHQLMQQQRRSERPPKLPPRDSMHSPTGFEIPKVRFIPDYIIQTLPRNFHLGILSCVSGIASTPKYTYLCQLRPINYFNLFHELLVNIKILLRQKNIKMGVVDSNP